MKKKRRKIKMNKLKKNASIVLSAVILLLLLISLAVFLKNRQIDKVPEGLCEFHFVDVGQGDCSMFLTDSGTVLIDAGPRSESVRTAAYIAYHTDSVDYFILTHPDEDHIGGAVDVINSVKIKNVIMTDAVKDTYSFTKLIDVLEKKKINVIKATAGKQFSAGGMTVTLLAPLSEFEDYNNYSIVAKIQYGDTSATVTGDAEQKAESLMLKKYGEKLKTNVLKLAHHGSSTSTGIDFFEMSSPDIAIISCGKNNDYNHPHREILELLSDFGTEYYRTDRDGSIIIVSDGKTVRHK